MCTCQHCGDKYKIDLLIPDELWEQIKPIGKLEGSGLLCGSCIMNKMEKLLSYSAFEIENMCVFSISNYFVYLY